MALVSSEGKDVLLATGDSNDNVYIEVSKEHARLIAAAPELLSELKQAEAVIRYAIQESRGRVAKEIVGGWSHHADRIAALLKSATL